MKSTCGKNKNIFISFLIQSFILSLQDKVYLFLGIFISLVELTCLYKSMLSFNSKGRINFMVGLAEERFNSKLFKTREWSIISRLRHLRKLVQ